MNDDQVAFLQVGLHRDTVRVQITTNSGAWMAYHAHPDEARALAASLLNLADAADVFRTALEPMKEEA